MCGRQIAWGSLGAIPDTLFHTDYRVEIFRLSNMSEGNCMGLTVTVSKFVRFVCLFRMDQAEPTVSL